MTDEDRRSLGARLRAAREYLGLSQDEVSVTVGLTRSAISLIETGQRRVDVLELKRLAEVYQRPIAELTADEEVDSPRSEAVAHLARAASELTEADRAELLQFAEFLGSRARKPKDE